MYDAVNDNRTRPQHKAWDNIVLPVDHPFWDTHYPPNGWNCRCLPRSLNDRDSKRLGLEVSENPEVIWEDREVKVGEGQYVTVRVPEGIHTGFAYNPSIAGFGRGVQERALTINYPGNKYEPLDLPWALDPANQDDLEIWQSNYELGNAAHSMDEAVDLLKNVIGGEEAVFIDPAGSRIRVTTELARHVYGQGESYRRARTRYFTLIPEIIEAPQEIWVGFARNEMTGLVKVRRRYIRYVRLDTDTLLGLVVDTYAGEWIALTAFQGKLNYLKRLRDGIRVLF